MVAVVVAAVQTVSTQRADEVEDRLTDKAFWEVVELLVTGVAFGLVGIEMHQVVTDASGDLGRMIGHAALVCVVLLVVRVGWMALAVRSTRRSNNPTIAPRTWREALVLAWSGMRGLATLALALAIPAVRPDGSPVPAHAELLVIAATVLVVTLLVPSFTLPALVRILGIRQPSDVERRTEQEVAERARRAAVAYLQERQRTLELPDEGAARLRSAIAHLDQELAGELPEQYAERLRESRRRREFLGTLYAEALAVAGAEVLRARDDPGVDPAAADAVLHTIDVQSRRLPDSESPLRRP